MKFITQSYLSLLNSFLFLSRFSASLKSLQNKFFRFAYKSLLNIFSVLLNFIMWSPNHFSISSCFLCFLESRFFRIQVLQGLGFSGSRFFKVQVLQGLGFSCSRFFKVRVQVLEVAPVKKRPWHSCFPVNFDKFVRTPFLKKISGACFCQYASEQLK